MESICLFCSYFISADIPNYVQYYVKELSRHFSRVVFITNEKDLTNASRFFLQSNHIELFSVTNEGYDFGMWYKAMIKYDVEKYDRLGLVNDSCILFKTLDPYFNWLDKENLDYAGMTDSTEIVYHIQSFFLTINKKAIAPTLQFFKQHGLQADREAVIKTYELGLCKHLQEQGLKTGAWYSCKEYIVGANPSLYVADKMIKNGFPIIKKKILFNSFSQEEFSTITKRSFNHNPNYYLRVIKKSNKYVSLFNFNLLKADGYSPDFRKIFSLQVQTGYYLIKKQPIFLAKYIYRKLKIRELRNKLNPSNAIND